ncbi:DegT/DnrJ/EryC1/StrS family aminotransferase [Sediminibacterium salmoneum]|uniref:DegT/DnrJ/EryC1/StrS family aminotransferase n=1 Tax=Sediminibacterium salmoneum TaxID=426421 RepID=UPI0021CE002C|nr:DegT/DnrJ/EryC1/StrS family aminotransferase [Sediminibacterium salmoneum]
MSKKTKAVVVNHTFGYTLNFLENLRKRLPENVVLIEDCCHVIINSSHELSKYVSKYSLCSFFSFNATKLLASGEGGAISTNNEKFANKISAFKIGDNLSNLSCSIALEQLKKLDYFLKKRKEIAELYISEFKNYLPSEFDYYSGIYFRFPILVSKNAEFWYSKAISYRKGVDSLISMSLNVKAQVNAYNILKDTVSLPIFPSLENFELEKIVSETHKLIRNAN